MAPRAQRPAVRANTLRTLLDRGARDPELREAQAGAMSAPPISTILKRQGPDGRCGASHLWRQISFPLFYQADVLFALRAIDAAGEIDDPRAQPAIAWLLARQDERGRWGGRAPFASRMPSRVDASKWVTLQAATILKHPFGEAA